MLFHKVCLSVQIQNIPNWSYIPNFPLMKLVLGYSNTKQVDTLATGGKLTTQN